MESWVLRAGGLTRQHCRRSRQARTPPRTPPRTPGCEITVQSWASQNCPVKPSRWSVTLPLSPKSLLVIDVWEMMQNTLLFTAPAWMKDPKKFTCKGTCFTPTSLSLPRDCGHWTCPTYSHLFSVVSGSLELTSHREHFGEFSEGQWI